MNNFTTIQSKLQQFIKKYYTNELIKGIILFLSFGLLYFIFTLFIEYFLWLQPTARRILFFVFIGVEITLLARFIIAPIFKLIGFKKGISFTEASQIIGNHFPNVDDKLLNILQLNKSSHQSELLLASIEQKSARLKPIPFKAAVNFQKNKKYLKYLALPILIWLFTLFTGNNSIFKDSLTRVVNYQTAYSPPAPFSFRILNTSLNSIEGKPFELQVETVGNIIPENAQLYFNNENYFLKDQGTGLFSYNFNNLTEPLTFYIEANGIRSREYKLNVIQTPTITGFEMRLNYPKYTQKRNEVIKNTGNTTVPEGTRITWNISTKQTDSVAFRTKKNEKFNSYSLNNFSITKRVRNNLDYQISTSNKNLKDYENLKYSIQVIKDEYPKINVKSDLDSVSRGPIQFAGQLSDDYGLTKLNLIYYDIEYQDVKKNYPIKIYKSSFEEFYYVFDPLGELNLQAGKDYELYFEVFDNDAVNGNKSVKSNTFSYHNKTKQEIADDLLKEHKESLDNLDKNAKDVDKLNKDVEEFTKKIKSKSELNWNDKKEFNQFLKRQEQYQKMFKKQTDKLNENLDELNENDETIKDKKEELQKRIEETQNLQKKERLLEELKKMAEKLDKEGLIDKLDKFTEQKKQEKRSLERLLELTKRFYTEKKAADISKKLDSLSKKQEKLSDSENNNAEKQKELNKEFDDIKKDLEELNKQNEELKQPMNLPDVTKEEKQVDELQQKAAEELKQQNAEQEKRINSEKTDKQETKEKPASLYQKSAAKKMKKMSQSMQQSMMQMEGEMMEENIEGLRAILENLVIFSLDQEALMLSLDGVDAAHPSFPKKLKKQQVLKEHFEHVDDSLYTLSLRLRKLTSKIQKDITEAHYNIDKSLENIAENKMREGVTNQQYTMTAANNLADLLSDMLNSMQNPSMGTGKGKGNSISLPDIIKKQSGIVQQMKDGVKKGEKEGKGKQGDSKEQMSGEQYQIYQQQQQLREALQEIMNKAGKDGSKDNTALKKMKELEKQLLDKGFTDEVLQNMLQLEHELLKLDNAALKQGKDNKRQSKTNELNFNKREIKRLQLKKLFFNKDEILNREPLPLRNNYKKKVQEYFKEKQG